MTALHHSVDGVIKAFKTERNLRIDYLIALVVMIAGVVLGLDKTEFVCLCLTIGFVLFSEMMNSVSEYIVDLITDKYGYSYPVNSYPYDIDPTTVVKDSDGADRNWAKVAENVYFCIGTSSEDWAKKAE